MKKTTSLLRPSVVAALLAALLCLAPAAVFAAGRGEEAAYPSKPINYLIAFDPGGQSDITALYQKPGLEKILGGNILIKYMPGAGGALAWAHTAKAAPDGYTITGNNLPHIIIQPLVRNDAGFQTEELVPLYLFQTTPIGLAVRKDSPYQTLAELIAYAKAHPGQITVGGSGTHSGHHLALMQLEYLTGARFTYIPSSGAAPSVVNLLGGHVAALFANSDDLVQHRQELTVLAIGTEEPFALLPGVETFQAQGIDMTAGIDRGVCLPPGTPEPILRTLEDAFDQVCRDPAFVAKMEEMGFLMRYLKSDDFRRYIAEKKEEISAALRLLGEIK